MIPTKLIVRCYVKPDGDQWVAVCIDLSLAAQARSMEQAKRKLMEQIKIYVTEAVTVDSEHAEYLLNRKAPLSQRLEYHYIALKEKFHMNGASDFSCSMPLVPARC